MRIESTMGGWLVRDEDDKIVAMFEQKEEAQAFVKYMDIPTDMQEEISFILGSIEMCNDEMVKPILVKHGYEVASDGFLDIEPKYDVLLAVDIYETLYKED